jgi:hypothetical protein
MPALPVMNEERFSPAVMEAAIRNLESTNPDHPDALDASEYPTGAPPLQSDSSFYHLALDYCERAVVGDDKTRLRLIDEELEDIIPLSDLTPLYPGATQQELTLLWLMVSRNWESFRAEVERSTLRRVLEQAAAQQVA